MRPLSTDRARVPSAQRVGKIRSRTEHALGLTPTATQNGIDVKQLQELQLLAWHVASALPTRHKAGLLVIAANSLAPARPHTTKLRAPILQADARVHNED